MEKENIFFFERGYFFLFSIFVTLVGVFGSLIFLGLTIEEYFSGMSKCIALSGKEMEICNELSNQNIASYMIHSMFLFAVFACGISLMHICVDSDSFYKVSKNPDKDINDFSYKGSIFLSFLFLIIGLVFPLFGYMDGKVLRWYTVDMAMISFVIVIFSTIFILYNKKQVELRAKEEIKE